MQLLRIFVYAWQPMWWLGNIRGKVMLAGGMAGKVMFYGSFAWICFDMFMYVKSVSPRGVLTLQLTLDGLKKHKRTAEAR